MPETLLLAKVLGIFLLLLGVALLLRWRQFIPVVEEYARSGLVRLVYAVIELLAGLFLVVMHNAWHSVPAALVSLLGWWAVLEAAAFLLLPDAFVARVLRAFNRRGWYVAGGIAQLLLGAYLTAVGFGLAS